MTSSLCVLSSMYIVLLVIVADTSGKSLCRTEVSLPLKFTNYTINMYNNRTNKSIRNSSIQFDNNNNDDKVESLKYYNKNDKEGKDENNNKNKESKSNKKKNENSNNIKETKTRKRRNERHNNAVKNFNNFKKNTQNVGQPCGSTAPIFSSVTNLTTVINSSVASRTNKLFKKR